MYRTVNFARMAASRRCCRDAPGLQREGVELLGAVDRKADGPAIGDRQALSGRALFASANAGPSAGRQDDRRIGLGQSDAVGRFAVALSCGLKQRPVVALRGERQPRRDDSIPSMRSTKSMGTAKQHPLAKGS
ncbi:hypothetical protein [Burkholderia lata]|uniref:hypothetical protein n=1 Tax=Burkholderia lata (strain ATCC 17760 / DSM 23089 / LMG 22485 / NCIMB 9086 / R18194 / 383) TaxID=482957 RepID=UPI0015823A29|nr:hypothetical protein [Burkholderia lata]